MLFCKDLPKDVISYLMHYVTEPTSTQEYLGKITFFTLLWRIINKANVSEPTNADKSGIRFLSSNQNDGVFKSKTLATARQSLQ